MTRDDRRNRGSRLREQIEKQTVVLPGSFNALTAMQIERAGFQALYISGASLSAARGLPDIGLLSFTEVVSDAAAIAKAVAIPAIVDADTGFGPPRRQGEARFVRVQTSWQSSLTRVDAKGAGCAAA